MYKLETEVGERGCGIGEGGGGVKEVHNLHVGLVCMGKIAKATQRVIP